MEGQSKKVTAPSHAHKVICPHCDIPMIYQNLKRHLAKQHPDKDSNTSAFYLRDSQSDKVLKPTKLTSFFGVKRKDEDRPSSPRPFKRRNASGDSAVSLDFTSGDDDGIDEEKGQGSTLLGDKAETSENDALLASQSVCDEECVISGQAEEKEPEKEPEKEKGKGNANVFDPLLDVSLGLKEVLDHQRQSVCDEECVISGKEEEEEGPEEEKEEKQEPEKEKESLNVFDPLLDVSQGQRQSDRLEPLASMGAVGASQSVCDEECVISGQGQEEVDRQLEGDKEDKQEDDNTTLIVKNQLLLTQVLVKLDKLAINKEESEIPTSTSEKNSEIALGKDIETKFVLASSISALEEVGFCYSQELNMFKCDECGSSISYVGEDDFTNKIQPNEFRNVKKKLRKHLMTTKHSTQVAQNKLDRENQQKNMSKNEKAGMIVATTAYNIIKKRLPVSDIEDDLYLLQKHGVDVGNLNHSYQIVYGLRPYFADEIRTRKKNFFSTHLLATGFLPVLGESSDGATHGGRGRHFHCANMFVPDANDITESPIRSMSLGVDILSKGKTGKHLVDSILQR